MNQLALIAKTQSLIAAGDIVGAESALVELADAEGDGALMVVLGAPEVAALIPVIPGSAASFMISRAFRPIAARAQLGLERLLDDLERQPSLPLGSGQSAPPSSRLAREVGQVVRDITTEVRKALEEK